MNERLKTHSKTQKKSADLVSNKLRIGVFQQYQMKCKSVSKKSPRYNYMTPFISVLISYTFISLDCLAEELEDPFGTENNDLPLDAICNAIEIDLLQMNDEAEIPAKILPDRHYQLT